MTSLTIKIFSTILIFFTCNIFAQDTKLSLHQNYHSNILQRNSDAVQLLDFQLQVTGATRFLPIFHSIGTGHWSSPGMQIMIDDEPYQTFPLNISSVDLLPFDFIIADSIEIKRYPSLNNGNLSAGGMINFITKQIPDTLSIASRLFFGSETGDPLIHLFTRRGERVPNKHKTGLSGAISLANGNDKLRYRFTTGMYLYFSTGSLDSDFIMYGYNKTLSSKQNRQMFGAAELEYQYANERKIKLYAGVVNQFGWEKSPVTSLYSLISGTSFTFRTKFEKIADNLDIQIRNDGSVMHQRAQLNTESGKYFLNYTDLNILFTSYFSNKTRIKIKPGIVNEFVTPIDGLTNFFPEKINRIFFYSSLQLEQQLTDRLNYAFNLRYDLINKKEHLISSSITSSYKLAADQMISTNLFSLVSIPGIYERESRYNTKRYMNDNLMQEFSINGNPQLQHERINGTSLQYEYKGKSDIYFSTDIFYHKVIRPIEQHSEQIVISGYPGEIVRSGSYKNKPEKNFYGCRFYLSSFITDWFVFRNSYGFVENKDALFAPKHLIESTIEFLLPYSVRLMIIPSYRSKTYWEHFRVKPENDFHKQKGFDGINNEAFIVDAAIQFDLGKFYFFNNVSLKGEVQNIFDKAFRYIPTGNNLETALFFYLTASI